MFKPQTSNRTGFRVKLLVAMMIVVSAITAVGFYVAQRDLTLEVARELQSQFQGELAALHNVQEVRHAALAERCRALVGKPRIHMPPWKTTRWTSFIPAPGTSCAM